MDTPNTANTGSEPVEAPSLSFIQRLTGIYFEPRKVFEEINRKRSWIGIFVIVSALAMAAGYLLTTRVPQETLLRKQLTKNPFTKNMSEEQIEQIVAQSSTASPLRNSLGIVFAPLGVLVVYIICAAVLLLIFVLMGASLTFKKSLAVTIWGMGPPSIILLGLTIVFLFVKDPDTLDVFNVQNNVISNLSMLADETAHPVLNTLLSSIDVFTFWTIYLLAVGFSAVSDRKLTMRRAMTGVLLPWGLWVVLKMGYFAVTG